mgnify:FL=1
MSTDGYPIGTREQDLKDKETVDRSLDLFREWFPCLWW